MGSRKLHSLLVPFLRAVVAVASTYHEYNALILFLHRPVKVHIFPAVFFRAAMSDLPVTKCFVPDIPVFYMIWLGMSVFRPHASIKSIFPAIAIFYPGSRLFRGTASKIHADHRFAANAFTKGHIFVCSKTIILITSPMAVKAIGPLIPFPYAVQPAIAIRKASAGKADDGRSQRSYMFIDFLPYAVPGLFGHQGRSVQPYRPLPQQTDFIHSAPGSFVYMKCK